MDGRNQSGTIDEQGTDNNRTLSTAIPKIILVAFAFTRFANK